MEDKNQVMAPARRTEGYLMFLGGVILGVVISVLAQIFGDAQVYDNWTDSALFIMVCGLALVTLGKKNREE